jgi:hypothetical protein
MSQETLETELGPVKPVGIWKSSRWKLAGAITAVAAIAFAAFEVLSYSCTQFTSSFIIGTAGIGGIVAALVLILERGVLKKLLAIPLLGLAGLAWLVHPITRMCG